MSQVLHISSDFPDPLAPAKTKAVSGLVELAQGIQHSVYSLNRISPGHATVAMTFNKTHRAVAYSAPPLGLAHRTCLDRLTDWIANDLAKRHLTPKAIHAHKLTVEGIVGLRLAKALDVPLIVTCQGNTDLKILHARPDLTWLFQEIWTSAAWLFALAPWTMEAITARLGPRDGPSELLPCPTRADALIAPIETGPIIRSVFGLQAHANKNARLVTEAAARAAGIVPDLRLEIVGAGPPEAVAAVDRLIARHRHVASLVGPVPHDKVQSLLNGSACLVVPSRRESYGMVFAEALMAGCPVIHGAGNGISGYFPGTRFAAPINEDSPSALGEQIARLVLNQRAVKAELASAQRAGTFDQLRRPIIGARYLRALERTAGVVPGMPGATSPSGAHRSLRPGFVAAPASAN